MVETKTKNLIHIDGESQILKNQVNINVRPKSINFII